MVYKPELSVVVIGRNEVANIRRCIDAIFDATEGLQAETLYVDSRSTDGTVEVASKYNITILVLREGWVLSAGAGRYIGTIHSKGDYILFCDGDIQICREWLAEAFAYIRKHPDIGGVGGRTVINHYYKNNGQVEISMRKPKSMKNAGVIRSKRLPGGVCLYRREALERAGHFNPYLYAEEEWELTQRVRAVGFGLVRLPICPGHHFTVRGATFKGQFRRKKYWNCYGQLLRICAQRKRLWEFLTGPGKSIVAFIGVLVIMIAASIGGGLTGGGIWWVVGPLLVVVIMGVYFTLRRKTVVALPLFFVRSAYILWWAIVFSVTYKPRDTSSYPTDAQVVKRAKD